MYEAVGCADPAELMATTTSNGGTWYGVDTDGTPPLVNGDAAAAAAAHDVDDEDNGGWCDRLDVKSLLQGAPSDSISLRTHVNRQESIVDAAQSAAAAADQGGEKVDLDFVDGQVLNTSYTYL